jgi:hypothetical protein
MRLRTVAAIGGLITITLAVTLGQQNEPSPEKKKEGYFQQEPSRGSNVGKTLEQLLQEVEELKQTKGISGARTIDGAKTPELIPEYYLWAYFLSAPSFYLPGINFLDSAQEDKLTSVALRYQQKLEVIRVKYYNLLTEIKEKAAGDPEALRVEVERLKPGTRHVGEVKDQIGSFKSEIAPLLSPEEEVELRAYLREQVARRLKIVILPPDDF